LSLARQQFSVLERQPAPAVPGAGALALVVAAAMLEGIACNRNNTTDHIAAPKLTHVCIWDMHSFYHPTSSNRLNYSIVVYQFTVTFINRDNDSW
jgi:hypothetical protein